ncbi:unnamed protein product [Litomosoides sigmodontis]|uniref:Uncharacterized protein n=1 Tax=Litomosoides sigmodontis TaxID=42156 RepID=A0A3P6TC22_LITSI|nr:unnamed protein product [Litomosoides sigmodontis]
MKVSALIIGISNKKDLMKFDGDIVNPANEVNQLIVLNFRMQQRLGKNRLRSWSVNSSRHRPYVLLLPLLQTSHNNRTARSVAVGEVGRKDGAENFQCDHPSTSSITFERSTLLPGNGKQKLNTEGAAAIGEIIRGVGNSPSAPSREIPERFTS